MSNKAGEKELGELHTMLAQVLKEEINKEYEGKDGQMLRNAAMLNVARQFLKDNGIQATAENSSMAALIVDLPSFDDAHPLQ